MQNPLTLPIDAFQKAKLARRLAANVYDLVIVIALLIAGTFLLLPLNHGVAIPTGTVWFQVYCLGIIAGYLCGSWYCFGQTIGMRAWRLIVLNENLIAPSKRDVILRFVWAIPAYFGCGIGALFAWHDDLSATRLMQFDETSKAPTVKTPNSDLSLPK